MSWEKHLVCGAFFYHLETQTGVIIKYPSTNLKDQKPPAFWFALTVQWKSPPRAPEAEQERKRAWMSDTQRRGRITPPNTAR